MYRCIVVLLSPKKRGIHFNRSIPHVAKELSQLCSVDLKTEVTDRTCELWLRACLFCSALCMFHPTQIQQRLLILYGRCPSYSKGTLFIFNRRQLFCIHVIGRSILILVNQNVNYQYKTHFSNGITSRETNDIVSFYHNQTIAIFLSIIVVLRWTESSGQTSNFVQINPRK